MTRTTTDSGDTAWAADNGSILAETNRGSLVVYSGFGGSKRFKFHGIAATDRAFSDCWAVTVSTN